MPANSYYKIIIFSCIYLIFYYYMVDLQYKTNNARDNNNDKRTKNNIQKQILKNAQSTKSNSNL